MWRCLRQQRLSSPGHASIDAACGSSRGDVGVLPTLGGLSDRSASLRYPLTVGSETPVSRAIEATLAPLLPSFLISSILSTPIISFLASNRRDGFSDNCRPCGGGRRARDHTRKLFVLISETSPCSNGDHFLLHINKSYYSERTVYPWVTEEDLETDLLDAVRDALRANDADHPWLSLSDGELLRAARLYGRDQLTGERGFNLAAVALLGKEDTILDVMPLYRTDAVLRRVETDRYDDRLVCKSNLVRAYDELVVFCEKWLPDSFVLDGGQRKSARDVIVRELVCNCLIHREFISPHIARITIDREGIRTSNASRALFAGPVTLESFDPTPKNPIIANFFTQMGRSEELGSGTRNLYKFSRLYTGKDPVLEDGDRFTAFVPVPPVMASMVGSGGDREAAKGTERSGAVGGSRRSRTRAEVESAVDNLIARYGSFPASAVSEQVTSVGERTVRRYLSDMVKEGKLVCAPRGRSTTYRSGNSADSLGGDC